MSIIVAVEVPKDYKWFDPYEDDPVEHRKEIVRVFEKALKGDKFVVLRA